MGNICFSAANTASPRDTMVHFDKTTNDNAKATNMSFEVKSMGSALHDRRDQASSAGANGPDEQTRYQIVKAKYFSFQGSWLGNVVGTTKLKKYAFSRNTQLFLTIHKKTKLSILVHQEDFGKNKQAACLYIFRSKNSGRKLRTFREQDIIFKSKISMRPIKSDLELEPSSNPYIIIVSHTSTKEGGYTLAIEGENEMTLKVPRTFTSWFDQPNRNKIRISGEWKGESSSGSPETNPSDWLKNSNQIPVMVKKPTRCLIRLIRTTPQNLSIGLFAVKSNGQASSEQYYAHQTLLDDDIVGQAGYTFMDTLEFRAFLQPKVHPYIFIPVVEHKGQEGTFDLEIYSDEEIQEVVQNRTKKTLEEQGIWFERSCGGRPGQDRFFRCPQYFLTIKTHEDPTRTVPVTITVDQHVEMNQYIPAGFYVLKAGYRVTKKNFQESMIIARKPSGFMKKITSEVILNNGQSYSIIPCPRSYNFSRDIPFTITLSTFLPSDTSISFDPCPENSDEFDNMEEFKATRIEGTWTKITSGGDPLSGKGFFNNPQYSLNTDVRTRIEISVSRISQKWIPMAFFIVRTTESNKKITHLDDLHKDRNGLFSHVEESAAGDRIIGQVRFSSGVEEEVSGNFTLASGTYTIIVASQISGKEGDFILQLKSDQDVEVIALPQIECLSTESVGAFIGGLSSLYPEEPHFDKNPRYICKCEVDQLVFLSLSQPATQMLNMCLYVKKNNEIVETSHIFSWKESTIQMTMQKDNEYEIYIATNHGKEGDYTLSIFSDLEKITLIPTSTVIGREISSFELHDNSKIHGEWFGLCDASTKNEYNPKYIISSTESTKSELLEFTLQSVISSLGIRVSKDSNIIYDSGIIENTSSNVFTRRVMLDPNTEYEIEVYPGEIVSKTKFIISLRSSTSLSVNEIKSKTQHIESFEAAWNIGRMSAADFRHQNFVHNPQWILDVKKKSRYVFEIEQIHKDDIELAHTQNPKYHSYNLFDETEDYITLPNSNESSVAIFLIHSNTPSASLNLESVSQDDILYWSEWRSFSNATLHSTLESSDKPYYIIVSGLGLSNNVMKNAFRLHVYSDSKEEAAQIQPVANRVFKAFEPDETFVKKSVQVRWSSHVMGHPDELNHQQEWIKNNKVKVYIHSNAKCKFSILHPLSKAIGIVIIKAYPSNDGLIVPNLYENDVYADSTYDPDGESNASTYVYLPASEEPYYVVPFCYSFHNESYYDLVLETDVASVKLELDYDPQVHADPIRFQSGWREGIAGGEPEENTFSKNPRFNLEISENAKDKIQLTLESNTKNKIKLFVFKRVIDEESSTPSVQEEFYQCSKWSLNGYTTCEVPNVPGSYVIIPSIYPPCQSASFQLKIQKDDYISVTSDDSNLVYYIDTSTQSPKESLKISLNATPISSHIHFLESISTSETIIFEIVSNYSEISSKLSHSDFNSTIGFYVLKGNLNQDVAPFELDSIAMKTNFISLASEISSKFSLEKGTYTLVPILISQGVKQEQSETLYLDFEFNSNEVVVLSSNTIVDSIPITPIMTLSDAQPNPEVSILLEGVSQIALRDDENGRFASPLTIFGPTVFPLLTGTSTSIFMYDAQVKNRRRILERLDKIAVSHRTLIDLYLPYAGAGTYGKGRVIAIGDPFIFNRHQLTTCDNYTFLMNCISWLLPDSNNSMQVDMFSASPRMSQKYRSPNVGNSPKRKMSNTPQTLPKYNPQLLSSSSPGEIVDAAKNASRGNRIAKPTVVCYSRQKDLLPVESLTYDYVVKVVNSFEKVIEMKGEVTLLILDHLDTIDEDNLKNLCDLIKLEGHGLLLLSSCHVDDDIRVSSSHVANRLLGEVGIVFGDSDIIENTNHNHDALWWMTQEEKKMYAKPPSFELQAPTISVTNSMHKLAHVGQCLRLFQSIHDSEEKNQNQEEYHHLCHVLYHACYTIPCSDTYLLPKLLELFGNTNLKISDQDPVLKSDTINRFALALNTNLWMNMSYKDIPSLRDREYSHDAETQEVTLAKEYQGNFSTGIYARSGEEITVTVPNILVGVGCTVQIGFKTQNLVWLRDSDLNRYALQWIQEPIVHNKTIISNPFGGQVYISIPATFFKSTKKQPIRLHITGGCASPQFKLQQTTLQQWQQIVFDSPAPYSEWISDRIILTIPTKVAKHITDPSVTLKFWRDAVQSLERIAHSRFPHTQRIIFDSQIVGGYTLSGYPCIVHEKLLRQGVIADSGEQLFDYCNVIRELAQNMQQKHSYVWNQRNFPIANVYKAYVLNQILGVPVNETEYYSKNIAIVRDYLHQGDDLSRAKRLQLYQNNTTLSTMLEFILIEEFGWEPYEKLFMFFHEEFDVKNRRILTNQEKVDRWVVRFSEFIGYDLSDFFEKFGLKVNASTKSKISVYPKWMVLLN